MLATMSAESTAQPYSTTSRSFGGPAGWLAATLAFTLLWDLAGVDLAFMRWLGSAKGFVLRHQWLLEHLLHDGLRQLAIGGYLLLWIWVLWPARWTRQGWKMSRLPRRERILLAVLVTLSLASVGLVKNSSLTSCPWDLQVFGGRAAYVSHWNLWQGDGGPGRCFPGGHASSAFGFLALGLPWLQAPPGRARSHRVGVRWLGVILISGLVAGTVQTLRGAHYPSHTLWTLIICGTVSLVGWRLALPWLARASD